MLTPAKLPKWAAKKCTVKHTFAEAIQDEAEAHMIMGGSCACEPRMIQFICSCPTPHPYVWVVRHERSIKDQW